MYSLEMIKHMNREQGDKARAEGIQPFLLSNESQLEDMPPFPFKNIGDLEIKNEKITSLFCDKSGFGEESEPALTSNQLLEELKRLLSKHGSLLVAIEEEGQFQIHLGVWRA